MDLPGLLTEIAFRHLWQGAIIIGIVSLLLSARQVWSAEHRSWMWLSALVLTAALPFITLIDLPAFEFGPPAESARVEAAPISAPANSKENLRIIRFMSFQNRPFPTTGLD